MPNRTKCAALLAALALVLASLACSTGGAGPTSAPTSPATQATAAASTTQAAATTTQAATNTEAATLAPTAAATVAEQSTTAATQAATSAVSATSEPLSGKLDVHGVSGYLDSNNSFHVVGLVTNGTDKPVGNIQLTIELTDSKGKSVLQDSSGNPTSTVTINTILDSLASGESTPFNFEQSTTITDSAGWQPKVQVASSEMPTDFTRAQLQVVHDQMHVDSNGQVYLTGDLVNESDKPAKINGFAGAMLVGTDQVAGAASFDVAAYLLSPAGDASGTDSTPFVISIYGPVPQGATPAYYFDAALGNASDIQSAASVHLQLAGSYMDANNSAHVVANITNSGTTTMTARVVAGLYGQDGKVLDASAVDSPIDLLPGQSVPVDLSSFSTVNGNSALVSQVVSDTIQVDPHWTFATSSGLVTLQASNVTTATSNSSVAIKGDLVNSTTQTLTGATVVVAVHDAAGKLVAVNWTSISPSSGPFVPKAKLTWNTTIDLPTSVDPNTLTFSTIVQGRVK